MSAKGKREKAAEKRRAKTGLTVARLREFLAQLPDDAQVRAVKDKGGGRLEIIGAGATALVYDSGEFEVEYAG